MSYGHFPGKERGSRTRSGGALLVDEREAARLLSISPRKLWGLRASGAIACVRIGSAVRYRTEDLLQFIAEPQSKGDPWQALP